MKEKTVFCTVLKKTINPHAAPANAERSKEGNTPELLSTMIFSF